jgi:ceramide glucosyltransferase
MLLKLLPYIVIVPSLAYSLISLFCALKYFKTKKNLTDVIPQLNISIIKPVKGMDEDSYNNFCFVLSAGFLREHQIVLLSSPDDPVIQLYVNYLILSHDIELCINPALHGPNYKV